MVNIIHAKHQHVSIAIVSMLMLAFRSNSLTYSMRQFLHICVAFSLWIRNTEIILLFFFSYNLEIIQDKFKYYRYRILPS